MLLVGLMLGMAIPALGWGGMAAWEKWKAGEDGSTDNVLGEYVPVLVPDPPAPPDPAKVIYLNREGARLTAGTDDANHNVSSIVDRAGISHADIPAFAGTNRRWNEILGCVRDRFSAFDVRIVDQRPVNEPYSMVVVGGTPDVLEGGEAEDAVGHEGHAHSTATGLAPFNGQVIEAAIVLVFSRKLRENARRTCETIGMEVAHAYGLDHAMHCGEIMSYLRPCGRRQFRDEDLPCGEHEERKCDRSTEMTQNSFQRLMAIWGPAPQS
jgi:hypothetical protein